MPKPQYGKYFPQVFIALKKDVELTADISLSGEGSWKKAADLINEYLERLYKKETEANAASPQTKKRKPQRIKISDRSLRIWWEDENKLYTPFISSLSAVTQYVKDVDWDTYYEKEKKRINLFFLSEYNVDDMESGKEYDIGWYPQYFVRLKYLGNSRFTVIEKSKNIKLEIGEEKEIYGFGIQYPEIFAEILYEKKVMSGFPLYPDLTILPNKPTDINSKYEESIAVNINNFVLY